jgi:predicted ATPase
MPRGGALVEIARGSSAMRTNGSLTRAPGKGDTLLFAAGELRGYAVAFEANPTAVSARATFPG